MTQRNMFFKFKRWPFTKQYFNPELMKSKNLYVPNARELNETGAFVPNSAINGLDYFRPTTMGIERLLPFMLEVSVEMLPFDEFPAGKFEIPIVDIENPFWDDMLRIVISIMVNKKIPDDIKDEILKAHPDMSIVRMAADRLDKNDPDRDLQGDLKFTMELSVLRDIFVQKYGWSIPFPPTIAFLASICGGKIVDMGAGNGYWSYLFAQYGVQVKALDQWIRHPHTWYPVEHGTPELLSNYFDHTLLLVWPPYNERMAYDALQHYKGNRLIYVGEFGGCTADDDFHDILSGSEWTEVYTLHNPNWSLIQDKVHVFERTIPNVIYKP
jgi:hypothetical protein